ncbi:hypothetical protein L7F22_041434 [Adiantum nelumboides]|nr:hypothetical protein [Adiantum nelumboides]
MGKVLWRWKGGASACQPREQFMKRPALGQHTRGMGQREFGEVCTSHRKAGTQGTAEAKVGLVRLACCAEQLVSTELQKQRRVRGVMRALAANGGQQGVCWDRGAEAENLRVGRALSTTLELFQREIYAEFLKSRCFAIQLNELKLAGSDLSDADLRGADLSLTNAAKANFTNANLEGALVTGNTSFKGAVITGADFTDVLFRDDQRGYLCSIADGVNSVTGNATRDTLGC